jgi:hypothetical protein
MLLSLIPIPTLAGTVTCAGKTYNGITFARAAPSGNFEVIKLWTTDPKTDIAHVKTPEFTIILNGDAFCKMQRVPLRVITDSGMPAPTERDQDPR